MSSAANTPIVHHGGAGTTVAAARAGVPQLVIPMFSDQFYWASRIRKLGIGTSVTIGTPTGEALTAALREALQPAITAQARTAAGRITSAWIHRLGLSDRFMNGWAFL